MKAVLDAGQFVSAIVQPHGHPAQVLAAWRGGQFDLVTSLAILGDLHRVLRYPRIRKRHQWGDEQIELLVDALALAGILTPERLEIKGVPDDPADDKVLACAIEGQVDYVVASDRHLTDLWAYGGIPIVRPRQFLELLENQGK